ncbi:thioredoxin [Acidocella sp.]|uniref:thioredoxin n=1 Tax=Acidocella sp. TaxID=50710 RepID=UPI002633D9A1|nr:thioredoxin [Acidocella sp.]
MTKAVTDTTFATEVLKSAKPVLVDFWAEWCGPCRAIAPALEDLSKEYDGKLEVVKVNIDENPMAPSKYGVTGIPTLLIFKNGQVAAKQVGAAPKSMLKAWIEKNL